MNAFDSDVLIFAAKPGHPFGARIRSLFAAAPDVPAGLGSLILLTEVLSKPMRTEDHGQLASLNDLLSRLELLPLDLPTADLAAALAAVYRLKAADAVHLATAVNAGADRFITNNQRDFPKSISEIEIVYPEDLEAA